MLKGLGQMTSLLKNAQEIQGRMQSLQDNLRRLKVTGSAGGGMVAVDMDGQQQVLACRIEPQVFAGGDRELLEDLLVAAVNQALEKVREATAVEMEKLTGGIDVSKFGDMLSRFGIGGGGGAS
ncbi:MAG: YbaB/EbfC family nucleoid-associated protein [Planctomycetaceae bacterium]